MSTETSIQTKGHVYCSNCVVAHGDGGQREWEIKASAALKTALACKEEFQEWAKNPRASQALVESRKGESLKEVLGWDYAVHDYCPKCGRAILWETLLFPTGN